jgi:predicted RNA-binding Zn-ribbon protein involved in translation (DUF1610 family)
MSEASTKHYEFECDQCGSTRLVQILRGATVTSNVASIVSCAEDDGTVTPDFDYTSELVEEYDSVCFNCQQCGALVATSEEDVLTSPMVKLIEE